MSYVLISGDRIAACTGGVFRYVRTGTSSNTLLSSPAYILASYIIYESIGDMTEPSEEENWPLFIGIMPDGNNVETNCGCLYDTSGVKDGRLMEGQVIIHYGVQLKIRSADYNTGWAKAETIMSSLDAVIKDTIIIDSIEYIINNVSRTSDIIPLGIEEGTSRRLFTVNFLLTMKRIV